MASDQPIKPITAPPDMTRMSKDKFCVLPGQPYIRCSTTNGGHTLVIGPAGMTRINEKGETVVLFPRQIPEIFVQEALGKGAVTENMLETLRSGVAQPATLPEPNPSFVPTSTPGMAADVRYDLIKRAMTAIVIAGKVEDFTQQGIPIVGSTVDGKGVSGACGFDITAAERDAIFSEVKELPEVKALNNKAE